MKQKKKAKLESGSRSGNRRAKSVAPPAGQIEVLKEQIRAQEDQEVRLKERKSVIESELSRKRKTEKSGRTGVFACKGKTGAGFFNGSGLSPGSGCDNGDALHLEMQIEDGKK